MKKTATGLAILAAMAAIAYRLRHLLNTTASNCLAADSDTSFGQ